jgi:xanthine dehydrogenase small subunit
MTLFALHQTERDVPTPTAVDDALAGNLCRCTGYRPIVDAALAMFETESDWQAPWGDPQTLKNQLLALADRKGLATGRDDRRFIAPASVDSLAETYAEHPDATLLAGGTDVGLWVTKQYRDLPTIISIGDIEELKRIEHDASGMIFGAAVTFTEAMPTLLAEYPELGSLLRRWASPPIRNAATLGGNIANGSPIGDSMPALIALGATVVLRKGGSTREIALEALYHDYMVNDLQPAEFVVAVRVPKRKPNQRVAAYKISKRFDQDISAVCAGISVLERADALHEVRVAFGGLAGTVKRAHHCEQALEGRAADAAQFEAAADALAQDFTPLTDLRASADYRLQVAGNLLRRFGLSVATPDAQLEVYDFGR